MPLGRSLTDAALLAPTATAGDTTFGNLASLGGASVAENAYYINGLNITNFDNYLGRSDERRVGQECVSTGRSQWSPDHLKTNTHNKKTCKHICNKCNN